MFSGTYALRTGILVPVDGAVDFEIPCDVLCSDTEFAGFFWCMLAGFYPGTGFGRVGRYLRRAAWFSPSSPSAFGSSYDRLRSRRGSRVGSLPLLRVERVPTILSGSICRNA